jgi:hypothetical protein
LSCWKYTSFERMTPVASLCAPFTITPFLLRGIWESDKLKPFFSVVVNYKMTSTINHETKQTYVTVLQPAHKYLNARRFDVIVKSVYAYFFLIMKNVPKCNKICLVHLRTPRWSYFHNIIISKLRSGWENMLHREKLLLSPKVKTLVLMYMNNMADVL